MIDVIHPITADNQGETVLTSGETRKFLEVELETRYTRVAGILPTQSSAYYLFPELLPSLIVLPLFDSKEKLS